MSNEPDPQRGTWQGISQNSDHEFLEAYTTRKVGDGPPAPFIPVNNNNNEIYPEYADMVAPAADTITHQLSKKKTEYKLKQQNLESKKDYSEHSMAVDEVQVLGFGPYQPHYVVSKPDYESNVLKATQYLLQLFVNCNSEYSFPEINNPRRALTKQTEPSPTFPTDNKDGDYILYVNEIIGTKEGHQFGIINLDTKLLILWVVELLVKSSSVGISKQDKSLH